MTQLREKSYIILQFYLAKFKKKNIAEKRKLKHINF